MFLRHTIDSPKVLDEIAVNAEVEQLLYTPGALLWAVRTGPGCLIGVEGGAVGTASRAESPLPDGHCVDA